MRGCDIRHAFNAIRLDMRPGPDHIAYGADGPEVARNRDVAIYDNHFSFIRDNAVEPEKGAQNWRFFNNRFYGVHGVISVDQVASRDLFIVGNWLLNDHRPGLIKANGDDGQNPQGGKFLKLFKPETGKEPQARAGFWCLYNSMLMRTSYVKRGATAHLHDAFSLMGMLPQWHPQSAAKQRHPFKGLEWSGVNIEGMVSDAVGFPHAYRSKKGLLDGVGVAQVFDPALGSTPARPAMDRTLGGWDGALRPTLDVGGRRSRSLRLETALGPIIVPGDKPLGAQDIAALGLAHWRDPWAETAPELV